MTDVQTCNGCGLPRVCCEECNPRVEALAAALWRKENPDMSVFACDRAMQNSYRLRVLTGAD